MTPAAAQAMEMDAIQSALSTPVSYVWGFESNQWRNVVMKVLDLMVKEGFTNLQSVGEIDLSQQLQKEWGGVLATSLQSLQNPGDLGALDMGDHAPMFQWLQNYIDVLNAKTRGIVGKIQLISDLTTMNYSLPVVFHPMGDWRNGLDHPAWVEYRLHFIPMSNIVTYWGSLEGCKYAANRYGATMLVRFCGDVATKLEFYMGRYLSPRLSDMIFVRANPGTVIDDNGPKKPKKKSHWSLPTAQDLYQELNNPTHDGGDL